MMIKELFLGMVLLVFMQTIFDKPELPKVQAESNKTIVEAVEKPETPKVVKSETKKEKPVSKPVVQPQSVPQPAPVPSSSSIVSIITDAANKHGIDVSRALRIAQCESGLNPGAVNYNYYENGHPSGLFQHISGYWPARAAQHGYPGASVFDPVANASVTMAMWASGSAGLWECR